MLLPSPLLPPALPLGHLPWLGGYFIIPDSRNIPSLLREQSPCKKGVQELSATGGEAGAALPACPRVVCVLQTHRTHFSLTPGWLQPLDRYNPQYFGSELPAPHSSPGAASYTSPCPPRAFQVGGSEPSGAQTRGQAGRAAPALCETSQKPKSPQEKSSSPGTGCTNQERQAGKPSPELCRGLGMCW